MRRRLRSWRPALRIARRDATRARGRSALVLVMIGLPVLAIVCLDTLTRTYTQHPCYYGHVYPDAQRERDTRVICRIHARRVTLDAIHV